MERRTEAGATYRLEGQFAVDAIADLAGIGSQGGTAVVNGSLCYITGTTNSLPAASLRQLFVYDAYDTRQANGTTIVTPAAALNGRWLLVVQVT